MSTDRQQIESLLEEYALDLLDHDRSTAVEEALSAHPDLRQRVDELRLALTALGDHAAESPPDQLWPHVVERALTARAAGRDRDTPAPANGPESYAETCDALGSLLDRLGPDQWRAMTTYDIPVVELVDHLLAVEDLTGERLGLWEPRVDPAEGHVSLRSGVGYVQPEELSRKLKDRVRLIGSHGLSLDQSDLDRPVELHGLSFSVETLFVVRAFEIWSHTEDIARATSQPLPTLSGPTLHRMASTATRLLAAALDPPRSTGRTFRLTLTGTGGGSWVYEVGGAALPAVTQTDATLVADVVDFCRLFADRVEPARLTGQRLGDTELLEDLLVTATAFADFGEAADRRGDR